MSRTVFFVSQQVAQGVISLFDHIREPAFHFVQKHPASLETGSWEPLRRNRAYQGRWRANDDVEIRANSERELVLILFDLLLRLPGEADCVLASAATYVNLEKPDSPFDYKWLFQGSLVALSSEDSIDPDLMAVDPGDKYGIIPMPSCVRLEPSFKNDIDDALCVEDVMRV